MSGPIPMGVLVDYSCTGCGAPHEAWVQRPIPAERACPVCGSAARRRFNAALLRGAAPPSTAAGSPSPAVPTVAPAPCQRYPTVPGLCHMTPAAARGWIARARKDNRALERDIARQEKAITEGTLDPSSAPITHDHGHGHTAPGRESTPEPAVPAAVAPSADGRSS